MTYLEHQEKWIIFCSRPDNLKSRIISSPQRCLLTDLCKPYYGRWSAGSQLQDLIILILLKSISTLHSSWKAAPRTPAWRPSSTWSPTTAPCRAWVWAEVLLLYQQVGIRRDLQAPVQLQYHLARYLIVEVSVLSRGGGIWVSYFQLPMLEPISSTITNYVIVTISPFQAPGPSSSSKMDLAPMDSDHTPRETEGSTLSPGRRQDLSPGRRQELSPGRRVDRQEPDSSDTGSMPLPPLPAAEDGYLGDCSSG